MRKKVKKKLFKNNFFINKKNSLKIYLKIIIRCQHSKCQNMRSEMCTPCKELCVRKCPHKQCFRFCGESCEPCLETCEIELACGHKCKSYCGHNCICIECDKNKLMDLDGMNEKELRETHYIYLSDCDHIVARDVFMSYVSAITSTNEMTPIKCFRVVWN